MMWSMIPCRPAMTFWSIVGHASFHTAGTMGPSMSERSYLEALMVSVAMKRRFAASLLHHFLRDDGRRKRGHVCGRIRTHDPSGRVQAAFRRRVHGRLLSDSRQ